MIGKLIQNKGVAASSQAFLTGVTTEVVGTMADSSKRQRDFEDESSWGVLTNPSEAGSPGQMVRAGYLAEMYHPSDTVYESGPMPGLGMMLDGPVNFLTPNGEDMEVPLPPGIKDVMEWSRTEIKLPKLVSRHWTYKDFVFHAPKDYELKKYAHFIMETYGYYAQTSKTKNYTQGVDFGFFLCRVRFAPGDQTVQSFTRALRS